VQVPRRIRAARLVAPVLALLCWLSSGTARAGSRDQKWKTLATEHFAIHFYAGSEQAAERAARVLERAHARLSVGLGHAPRLRTHVLLTDATDEANGSATVYPYPSITAHVTAPESMSVLESYDNWLDVLLTHEYTHIVHNDTIHGLPRAVNAILGFGVLGRVWAPNSLQPRWILEGLATYEESRLTSQGRHRSTQFDMMLRMIVLEQGFPGLDRISGPATIFPHTTAVYLYGLHLLHYLGTRYGHDKLRELSNVYGGRAIPYSINRAAMQVYGVDFYELWKEFQLDTTRRFQAQARAVRARGIREGRRLTFSTASEASGAFNRHPFWSPDDQHIYFYGDDGHANPGIRRIPATGGRIREGVGAGRQGMTLDVERVIEVQGSATASFVPGSDAMVFEQTNIHDFRYRWSELYLWRPPAPGALEVRQNPQDLEALTVGLRARDPHPAPDGRSVVFVRNDTAQSRLAFVDLHTRVVTEVAPFERLQQIYNPRFAPDGRRVAFSAHREGGYRDIYVYDRETGKTERITADRHLDGTPAWSPDGRWLLFSSDRDEIFNIYAHDGETGRIRQVTNVLGGAFDPLISHDGTRMVYVGFSAIGYDLWVMKFDPAEFIDPLPVQDDLPATDLPDPPLPGDRGRPAALGTRRYQPIRTLYPRVLTPASLDFGNTGNLGTDLGLKTAIADVVGFHALTGTFRHYFRFGEPTGSASYTYSQLLPSFRVEFVRGLRLFDDTQRFIYDNQRPDGAFEPYAITGYRERETTVRAAVTVPVIRHPIHSASATLTYGFTRLRDLDQNRELVDPNAPVSVPPAVGDIGRVDLDLEYSGLRAVRYSYADETGRSAAVRLAVVDRHLGGQFGDIQVAASYSERVRMPWRGHQVLALRLSGGAAAGGLGRIGSFRIGGNPNQEDVIEAFLRRAPFGEAGKLRGFAQTAARGNYFAVLNAEYRIPFADVERGLGTLPVFMRRVTSVLFADYGGAWSEGFTRKDLMLGLGASLIFSFRVGYRESIDLFVTYAHGFHREVGADLLRVLVARSF
jgi:hypothetical protein